VNKKCYKDVGKKKCYKDENIFFEGIKMRIC